MLRSPGDLGHLAELEIVPGGQVNDEGHIWVPWELLLLRVKAVLGSFRLMCLRPTSTRWTVMLMSARGDVQQSPALCEQS